jgi:thioesterase domain-containing protein
LFEAPTIASLIDRLNDVFDSDSLATVLPIRKEGARETIFCLPPNGGLSWCYSSLATSIQAEHPIYGLQSRGFAPDDDLPGSVEEMARIYASEITNRKNDGGVCLIGWSFGGVMAHSVGVELQSRGVNVKHLIILDGYPWVGTAEEVHSSRELKYENLIDEFGLDGFKERLRCVKDNNSRILRMHTPGLYDGDIVLFRAKDSKANRSDAAIRWTPYNTGDVNVIDVDADHQFMCERASLKNICRIIDKHILNGIPDHC